VGRGREAAEEAEEGSREFDSIIFLITTTLATSFTAVPDFFLPSLPPTPSSLLLP
jgi:hypothetical protein